MGRITEKDHNNSQREYLSVCVCEREVGSHNWEEKEEEKVN
jgi:hypothetical protein